MRKSPVAVHFGEWNPSCTGESHLHSCSNLKSSASVSSISVHEGYSASSGGDNIALLRLETNIQFDEHVKPICVAKNEFENVKQLFYPQWNLKVKDLTSDTLIKRNDVLENNSEESKLLIVKPGCVLPGGPLVHVVFDESGKAQSFVVGVNAGTTTLCGVNEQEISDMYTKVSDYTDFFLKQRWRH